MGPRFRRALTLKNRKHRFREVMECCRTRHVCESGDDIKPGGENGEGGATAGGKQRHNHGGCGNVQPKITWSEFKMIAEFKPTEAEATARKIALTPEKVYNILKNVSDEDCRALGFNPILARPEWMLTTVLPVPPPAVRPSIVMDSARAAEDDLTYKLSDICKANNSLKQQLERGAAPHIIQEFTQLLQYHIATMIDNEMPGMPVASQRGSGRPLKSIRQRLRGKHGRIRGNLMGKRVDFSARTVITPDPNLSVNEVRCVTAGSY